MQDRYCCRKREHCEVRPRQFEPLEYSEKSGYYEDAERKGYSLADVRHYNHLFITANSIEELKKKFDFHAYTLKYGKGENGDVACPKCGFKHNVDYYDDEYGYLMEGHEEFRDCFCGTQLKFHLKVEVQVIADVIVLKPGI